MKAKRRKAFSLTEIAIGTVVILVLLAIALPRGDDTISAGKKSSDMTQISAIANAISQYKYEIGDYPPNLAALLTKNGAYGPWLPISRCLGYNQRWN